MFFLRTLFNTASSAASDFTEAEDAVIELRTVATKAVNREDKRSRRYRDRDFAKFERSRRY